MKVFYNEIDPYPAQWLENLSEAGHIPVGHVERKSIIDIAPEQLDGYVHAHFFAGIGGWPLALRMVGWNDNEEVWTGSCPCQPFSVAGKRKGTSDERHLWPDWLKLIDVKRPATIFGEQVSSKDGRVWLAGVRSDLEALGYGFWAVDTCAAGVGAPHIRQRLYWVAYTMPTGRPKRWPSARFRQTSGGRSIDGVADANDERFNRQYALLREENGRTGETYIPEASGGRGIDGMANAEGAERNRLGPEPNRAQGRFENSEWMGDPNNKGPQGRGEHAGEHADKRTAWSSGEFIPCLDGKARRIEPSIQPLAHGVPARVGRLRAYGNAIVPQVAAEFIKAFLEARNEG